MLLRPVDESLALLLLVLNAVGVAVQCASYLPLLAVLAQADNTVNVDALTGGQLDAVALLSVSTYRVGFVMAQLFFSAWLFPLGWLVLRCGFLPRFLGWLLLLDGVAVIVWFLQVFLAPEHPAISYPSWAVGFIAELGLALWLLIKRVKPANATPAAGARPCASECPPLHLLSRTLEGSRQAQTFAGPRPSRWMSPLAAIGRTARDMGAGA